MLERMKVPPTKAKQFVEITLQVPGSKKSHYKIPNTDDVIKKLDAFLHKLEKCLDLENTPWEESTPWHDLAKDRIARYSKAGIALRGARYREGLSQKELAQQCLISQDNLSRMENGKRTIGEKIAKRLAKALNIDYQLLLSNPD
jgi:DNA-binding XRE family transcriptional regulator